MGTGEEPLQREAIQWCRPHHAVPLRRNQVQPRTKWLTVSAVRYSFFLPDWLLLFKVDDTGSLTAVKRVSHRPEEKQGDEFRGYCKSPQRDVGTVYFALGKLISASSFFACYCHFCIHFYSPTWGHLCLYFCNLPYVHFPAPGIV